MPDDCLVWAGWVFEGRNMPLKILLTKGECQLLLILALLGSLGMKSNFPEGCWCEVWAASSVELRLPLLSSLLGSVLTHGFW